jgi:hypothetical protein
MLGLKQFYNAPVTISGIEWAGEGLFMTGKLGIARRP